MSNQPQNRFLLLFGSQTGQAKAIAEEISEKAHSHDLFADVYCFSQTEKEFNIEKEPCVVIVVSTTGEGEPPDTAQKFWRQIRKSTLSENHLKMLNYTLLGLGDSNYTNFCNCGKTFDQRLEKLGAHRFYPCGWADDAVGLELVVESWIENLWPALQKFFKDSPQRENAFQSCPLVQENAVGLRQNGTCMNSESKSLCDINGSVPISDNSGQVCDKVPSQNFTDSVSGFCCTEKFQYPVSNSSSCDAFVQVNSAFESINGLTNCSEPSLVNSLPPLSESSLTLPVLSHQYLQLSFLPEEKLDLSSIPIQNGSSFPSMASLVTMATVISAKRLTRHDAVKTTLDLELDIGDSKISYQPGDSISVICQNDEKEVERLLQRLGQEKNADVTFDLTVLPGTAKRNPCCPDHIPPRYTLRHTFLSCVDIRSPAKKAFLRVLSEHTPDPWEKRRLLELCSKQGAAEYTNFIRQPALSLLDILTAFPLCQPPAERLLELLPRLQPRPYSIASSPKRYPDKLHIVFTIVEILKGDGRAYNRHGVCTKWLDKVTKKIQTSGEKDSMILDIASLTFSDKPQIPIFARTNQNFHLPGDQAAPLILVGPGTGVAPFIGFLQHRLCLQREAAADQLKFGEVILFYGCRHKLRDYLYRFELEEFVAEKTLGKLNVCFSRDEQPEELPKYVQDSLKLCSADVVRLIDSDARIYVCGDAKNMAKDVNNAFVKILSSQKGITEQEAQKYLMQMRLVHYYSEDVWL